MKGLSTISSSEQRKHPVTVVYLATTDPGVYTQYDRSHQADEWLPGSLLLAVLGSWNWILTRSRLISQL